MEWELTASWCDSSIWSQVSLFWQIRLAGWELKGLPMIRERHYSSVKERSSSVGERRERTKVSMRGCGGFKAPSNDEREGDDMDLGKSVKKKKTVINDR